MLLSLYLGKTWIVRERRMTEYISQKARVKNVSVRVQQSNPIGSLASFSLSTLLPSDVNMPYSG
jgi:hypothetical protein